MKHLWGGSRGAWVATAAVMMGMTVQAGETGLRFPGHEPGVAIATHEGARWGLSNHAMEISWKCENGRLRPLSGQDKLNGEKIPAAPEIFILRMRDGSTVKASSLKVQGGIRIRDLAPVFTASRKAEQIPGKMLSAVLSGRVGEGVVQVEWSAEMRDGSNYIRQQVAIRPEGRNADIREVVLIRQHLPGAALGGAVPGSPILCNQIFMGFEHPMSESEVSDSFFRGTYAECRLALALPVKAGQLLRVSSVLGVTPEGQLRRGFQYYVERERAHAYRTFLHYNSWYDIGYFTRFDEKQCLAVIGAFAEELGKKRGVKMDSFLFDDGWDETHRGGEWKFHDGFPNGFTPVKEAAMKCGAAPGIWLSPWGGYGDPRKERVKSGRAAGYETATNMEAYVAAEKKGGDKDYEVLFALSGPKYYEKFHGACMELVEKYGINQFKLDGTGNIDSVVPGSAFGSDFEAAISLISDLRTLKPDLFINLTTGTWPSPFWLSICDSIWRGGWDHEFKGVGSARQRWLTFRDGDTYQRIVKPGPLFPLNSLMLHGVIYAKEAHRLNKDPEGDFTSEVRSYFGSGTQLQELYVSHQLMTEADWNTIAECAKWSRTNADTLVDTHWIGGDPYKLELYGWASWSPAKGIIVLRNPADEPQTFDLDAQELFELPAGAAVHYKVVSPFKQHAFKSLDQGLTAGKPVSIELRGFEVVVLEAIPAPESPEKK